jgi:class 3 adenylate cyclase
MSTYSLLLEKFGLHFPDDAYETAFVDIYIRGWAIVSQVFLVVGGAYFSIFAAWDMMLDPVNGQTGLLIRGLFIMPLFFVFAAILLTDVGKRHIEAVLLSALFTGLLGGIGVYSALDKGFDYAALLFVLLFMGVTAAMPVRARYLLPASLIYLAVALLGHLWADNARPGMLLINFLSIACAFSLGSMSVVVRERAARQQFMTDRELDAARARVDELLFSILPRDIVQRIQSGESEIAESLREVTIVFADLAGFTELARQLSAQDLVKVLAKLFSAFDKEAERYNIDRIKTIGDAYMAISGIGRSVGRDHVEDAADFAIAVQAAVHRIQRETGYPIDVRIGMHVGPVVAGVIGRRRPAFDCWGESVNLASRLESNAPRGGILISESVFVRLKERFDVEGVDAIDLKGIGFTKAFVLRSRVIERTALRLVS